MSDKVCEIHGLLDKSQIRKEITKTGSVILRCRECRIAQNQRYKEANRKQLCEKNKIYKKNNRHIVNAWTKKDRLSNPEKYRAYSKRNREKLGSFRNIIEIARRRKISTNHYEELLKAQDGKCAICNNPEKRKNRSGKIARLCLDHDHQTSEIRGFLCHDCNTMLGKFKENIEIMESAIEYLKKHGELCLIKIYKKEKNLLANMLENGEDETRKKLTLE